MKDSRQQILRQKRYDKYKIKEMQHQPILLFGNKEQNKGRGRNYQEIIKLNSPAYQRHTF